MKDANTREEVEEIIKKYESMITEKDKEIEKLKRKLWEKDLEITYSGILSSEELERIKNLDPTQAIIELGKILKAKNISKKELSEATAKKENIISQKKENTIKLPTDDYIDKLIKEVESTIGEEEIGENPKKKTYKDPFEIGGR